MKIVKHSGALVDFQREKLKRSLLKSGANEDLVSQVLSEIEKEIYDGISTKKIYKLAFSLLKKISSSHAARYNLKTAIQLLGPSGFFFEKYVARLFESENYTTLTNIVLKGKCVSHEIDVIMKKDNVVSMVECKFHGSKGVYSDVKVPMYILSRFNDVNTGKYSLFDEENMVSSCCIVTNSRFTADAIDFAVCSNLKLLSWDYPDKNNIRNKIDDFYLYPVTCLTTLTIAEKEKLLILDVILVKELIENANSLRKIGLKPNRIENVLKEATALCNCT